MWPSGHHGLMATVGGRALMTGIRVDLRQLHDRWMALLYPRQLVKPHAVLGRWRPDTPREKVSYYGWGVVGAPLVLLLYPLVLLGYITRFYARGVESTARRIGLIGVMLLPLILWGLLTAVAYMQFSFEGFAAVLAATIVATLSAGLAYVFARVGGRGTTVLLAYPFAMNAIFLPPVVAALYSPFMARHIFPGSELLAIWILDNILYIYGINQFLRAHYTLEGVAYVGMWIGIAVPLGWILGTLVTLADIVRPSSSEEGTAQPAD